MSLRKVLLAFLAWSTIAMGIPASAQNKPAAAPKAAAPKADAPKAAAQKPAEKERNVPKLTLGRVASEKSLVFLTTNGWKPSDPKSQNKTEQLFAEKSVQEFFRKLIDEIKEAVESQAARSDEDAVVVAKTMPVLFSAAIEHPMAISLAGITVDPMRPGVDLAIVIDTESDSEKVTEALDQLIGLTPEEGPNSLVEETIQGATFYYPGGAPPQAELVVPHFGMYKSYLIFTMGPNMVEQTIAKLDDSKKAPEWLDATVAELKVDRPSLALQINVQGFWDAFDPLMSIPQVKSALDVSGLLDLKRIALVSGLEAVVSVNKLVVETSNPPKELLALLPDKPLAASDLKGIPVSPAQAHVVRFDLENLVETALKITDEINPGIRGQFDGVSQQMEGLAGFSFKKDFLKAFGDLWSLYIVRVEGSSGSLPEIIFTASVKDFKKMSKVQDALVERTKQTLKQRAAFMPNATLEEFKAKDLKGYQINVNNVTVAWLITKDQLIVGNNSDLVKAHQTRFEGKESLADNKEIIAAMKRDPKTVLISYQDPRHEIEMIYSLINQFSPLILSGLQSQGIDFELPDLPPVEDLKRHLAPSVSTLNRTAKGWNNEWQGVVPSATSATPAIVGISAALLLPAVGQARMAARRTQSKNNLKQIGLAMFNYESTFSRFPDRATKDKKDKPLLSWRVQILPYIDQAALYNEFHMDEPWDSEHNKKLIDRMPQTYASPENPELAAEGKTRYLVAVGDGTLFDGDKGPQIRDVTDGTSNTIMVLEASPDNAVVWTQPDDLEIDFDDPLDGLVGNLTRGFHALLSDGSVRFISDNIDVGTFKALLTKAGGEVIGDF